MPPLALACTSPTTNGKTIKFLLDAGDKCSSRGDSAIHVSWPYFETTQILLRAGVSLFPPSPNHHAYEQLSWLTRNFHIVLLWLSQLKGYDCGYYQANFKISRYLAFLEALLISRVRAALSRVCIYDV